MHCNTEHVPESNCEGAVCATLATFRSICRLLLAQSHYLRVTWQAGRQGTQWCNCKPNPPPWHNSASCPDSFTLQEKLGSHWAAGRVGLETRTDGFEKFRLLWDSKTGPSSQKVVLVADFIICSKVKLLFYVFIKTNALFIIVCYNLFEIWIHTGKNIFVNHQTVLR